MTDKPITVYPVADEADDAIEVPEFRPDSVSNNINDSESNNHLGLEQMSSGRRKSFGSVATAVRIAKWMAKAFGYAADKKSLYINALGANTPSPHITDSLTDFLAPPECRDNSY